MLEKTLELEKMFYAFPVMSLNYHQIVSRLSKFRIEKSLPAKKSRPREGVEFLPRELANFCNGQSGTRFLRISAHNHSGLQTFIWVSQTQ